MLVEAPRVEIIFSTLLMSDKFAQPLPTIPPEDFSVVCCHQPSAIGASIGAPRGPVVRQPGSLSSGFASTESDHAVSRRRGTPAISRADADPPIQDDPRFVACANRCDSEELEPMRAGEDTRPQFA